jgi:hypothetical protein
MMPASYPISTLAQHFNDIRQEPTIETGREDQTIQQESRKAVLLGKKLVDNPHSLLRSDAGKYGEPSASLLQRNMGPGSTD